MMPAGGSSRAEDWTEKVKNSFAWSGAPHSSSASLLPFLPTLFLAASGRGQDGRESKENRKRGTDAEDFSLREHWAWSALSSFTCA